MEVSIQKIHLGSGVTARPILFYKMVERHGGEKPLVSPLWRAERSKPA
jgi:hypothetical protein